MSVASAFVSRDAPNHWLAEVDAAFRDVWVELSDIERDILRDVPVRGRVGDGSAWGRFFNDGDRRWIDIYQEVFDAMPDPENRARQVRDVIRHEFHHGLGYVHPEQGEVALPQKAWAWLMGDEVTVVSGGIKVTLPESLP